MNGNQPTRRQVLKIGAIPIVISLPALFGSSPALAAAPTRKNIDTLTPDELETYKHAVKILMDRSGASPGAMEGYAWQAALHNDFDRIRPDGLSGGCEHRSELFFPWHRAHLAGFEKILRETDPPRTEGVTIPYWDWTLPASGVRFPKAFEDTSSPLFNNGRYKTPSDVPKIPPGLRPMIQWDAEEVKTKMVQEPLWFLFAGNPQNPSGSFGWVEDGPHNTIHPSIGITMGKTKTASRDPIYWSFHAYIDLIWARWQRVHTDASHPQPFATPNDKIWVEPFIPTVADMAQTDTLPAGYAYGYDYDFSIDAPPIVVASESIVSGTAIETVQKNPLLTASKAVRFPSPRRKLLHVEDVAIFTDVTYALQVYVHPPSVDLAMTSDADKARYLADSATVWMSGGHMHRPTDIYFDLTKAIASMGDQDFVVSVLAELMPLAVEAQELMSAQAEANKTVEERGRLWGSWTLEER